MLDFRIGCFCALGTIRESADGEVSEVVTASKLQLFQDCNHWNPNADVSMRRGSHTDDVPPSSGVGSDYDRGLSAVR